MDSAATEMAHKEAQALFASMVDRELAPAQEALFKGHLEQCAECRQGFARYTRAVELVRSVARERAPAELSQLVLKRVHKRRRGQGVYVFQNLGVPTQVVVAGFIVALIATLMVFVFLR